MKIFCIIKLVVQSLSCVQLFLTSWTIAHRAPLSSTVSQNLLKFRSIELIILLSNYLILCWPLLLLPSIFPRIMVFSNDKFRLRERCFAEEVFLKEVMHELDLEGWVSTYWEDMNWNWREQSKGVKSKENWGSMMYQCVVTTRLITTI